MTSPALHDSSLPHDQPRANILFIIDQLCHLGGAERVLLNMIHRLPKHRFTCSIVTFKPNPQVDAKDLNCAVHVLPLQRTWNWDAVKVALALRRLIRELKIDIVHTFFETSDLWAAPIAKLSRKVVLISSRRDMGILRSTKHHLAYRLAAPLYDQVQAVSNQVRAYCISRDNIDPQKVVTVYNGVSMATTNCTVASDVRDAANARHATSIIATVANIRRMKGLDIFIRAAEMVRRQYSDALFLIIGENADPAYAQELENLIQALGLTDRVLFLGKRDDVFSVLHTCDVFCLLSRTEGLSNALLEAMASSRPCVATAVGGNPELIDHGRNGYLVPNEDVAAAAEKILDLLRHPGLALRFGQQGRATIESQFTIEAMIDHLTRLYSELLVTRAAGSGYTETS